MKKCWKYFAAIAVIGTVAGLLIAYFCRKKRSKDFIDDSADFTDEEDFDLDIDLKPVSDREYVPLNKAGKNTPESTDITEEAAV